MTTKTKNQIETLREQAATAAENAAKQSRKDSGIPRMTIRPSLTPPREGLAS